MPVRLVMAAPKPNACPCSAGAQADLRSSAPDSILWGLTLHLLRLRWSPEQISPTLARLYPLGHEYRVSHETIYNCIHAMPVGELRKELTLPYAKPTTNGRHGARARTAEARSLTC